MGCDIHIIRETKIDGKWVGYKDAEVCDNRNYGLFAYLADVRNYGDIKPLSKPRGLPDDISGTARDYITLRDGDLHSMTWYMTSELKKAPWKKAQEENDCTFEAFFTDVSYLDDDERLIIAFDN